jgi:hypothetical protein
MLCADPKLSVVVPQWAAQSVTSPTELLRSDIQSVQFEPTNAHSSVTITLTLQQTNRYMFRPSLFHHQWSHSCAQQVASHFLHVAELPKYPECNVLTYNVADRVMQWNV